MSKTDPDFFKELNAIIAQEAKRVRLDELRDTDWTVLRMMKEHRLKEGQARKVLDKLVADGRLEKINVANPNGGGARLAYRPIEKK